MNAWTWKTPGIALAVLLLSCAAADPDAGGRPELAPGFYEVLARADQAADLPPLREGVVNILQPPLTEDGVARVVQVAVEPTVPLRLASPPRWSEFEGRPAIQLSLHESTSQQVREFTATHLGALVAVVIGGEAATVHKIREPILMPEVQITSCDEGGIERLWEALAAIRTPAHGTADET